MYRVQHRVEESRGRIIFILEDNECCEEELAFPIIFEICPTCQGRGSHAHAIDGNGITSSEWAEWHDDEKSTYLSGGYDRTCEGCSGGKVVPVVDESTLTEQQKTDLERVHQVERDLVQIDRISAMERRYGA